jgi:hypothetical protein
MIELNEKTQQDFLNREWVQRLLDIGVDVSDAKYCIIRKQDNKDYIAALADLFSIKGEVTPTYSTAELLYKLNEWPSIKLPDEKLIGARLDIFKDAPFYFACYYFGKTEKNDEYRKYDIECDSEYPIEALAQLLIASAKSDFYNFKYVRDISSK